VGTSSRLDGKIVLVTGAARGIGAATARLLAQKGAHVALLDLDRSQLEALRAELGDRHIAFVADVTDSAALDAAVAGTVERFGGIDVVMANAGIASYGSVGATDPEAFIRTIDVNLSGVFRTVRAALPHVVERRGYVMVTASLASFVSMAGMAAYAASKAGAEAFANSLRLEVAHRGVAVGSVHPSWIDTDMVRGAQHDLSAFDELRNTLPGPLRSTTTVEECAAAIVEGMERRSMRVCVPRYVAWIRWLRPALSTRIAEWVVKRDAARLIPQMDQEIAMLGRSLQEHVEELPEAEQVR
jgi:NAD(P)-dependent dehydrogenase (short-subunit alcohol dehydrogenase family)